MWAVWLLAVICIILVLVIFRLYGKLTLGWCSSQVCLKGKTVIVTGANTGIGYETAVDLAKRGARVIIACRSEEKAREACEKIVNLTNNDQVVYKLLDLGSLKSVRNFAEDINSTEQRLDILVNNAGLGGTGDKVSEDGLLLQMQTNYFGPVLLTHLLIDMLKKTSGRIVNVSSVAAKYAKFKSKDIKSLNEFIGGVAQYNRSKLMNILYTIELADKLKGTGVTTYSLHPGAVRTNFFGNANRAVKFIMESLLSTFGKNVVEGAQTSIYCAVAKDIEQYTGENFDECKVVKRYSNARDPELAKQLWIETTNILHIE